MKKIVQKLQQHRVIIVLLFAALIVRFYFLDKFTNVSGDLLLYADWGKMYWEYTSRNFYFVKDWYYAPPNYPPLVNLYYAYAYKAFDYKYLFAQLHNIIRFPPADFIIYYYKWGYFINLKILAIVCDLLTGVLLYNFVYSTLKKKKTAVFTAMLYLFNPVVITLSSVWGQTDSVIAYFSVVSFILLFRKKFALSSLLFMAGLLFKPNWVVFIPLYLLAFFLNRPRLKSILISSVFVLLLLAATAYPFSENPFTFYHWIISERIIPTIGASKVASVSAFNFYTIFLRIDYHLSSFKILVVPVGLFGQLIFAGIYLAIFLGVINKFLIHKKVSAVDFFKAILILGLGSFLFLPGILERYFFPAIIPFAAIAVVRRKTFIIYLLLSLSFSLNIVWALFRRQYGELDHLFTDSNFLLIRIFSLFNVLAFIFLFGLLFKDNLLKLDLWKKRANTLIQRLR